MRISSIQLAWFRGAADPVSLEPDCKSMVVYGINGSGKSTFVDAVEFVLNDGKIGHLNHEYSGRRQEKAIPNTHKPHDRKTEFAIKFKDNSEHRTEIKQNGSSSSSGAEAAAMATWDYRRTVLRQDELSAFIHDTKGNKYSALLPLMGLQQMEVAAENLRQLVGAVETESNLKEMKGSLKVVEAKRNEVFGSKSDNQILKTIKNLHAEYCTDGATARDGLTRCKELESVLDTRIKGFSADDRQHVCLKGVAGIDLKGQVDAVRRPSVKLAGAVEPLINEKLEVLQWTSTFVEKLGDEKQVNCPACGQPIPVESFSGHVKAERERLQEISDINDERKAAIGNLCDTLNSLKSDLGKPDVKSWRDELVIGALADNFAYLDEMNSAALRVSCSNEDLKSIEGELLPLIAAAALNSKDAPPDVQALSTVKRTVETGKDVILGLDQVAEAARAEALVSFINSLAQQVREEIRLNSQTVIDEISADIQAMWETLHPGEAIENVRLYLPEDVDKAIDISLKFHGVEQDSPRLTLSEGFRNSLGLCIFLAMAKREGDKDRPLFLDDVVVSMDRNHRGMVVELLKQEFSERQVVILTHDREWYIEMRHQLDGNHSWVFKALLPYETPDIGVRWSHKTTTFGDARAQVKERPDSAGTDARKIMDVELAIIAERLQIRLPYLRSDRNDMRMAHNFLERLVADGKKCFQTKMGNGYKSHTDAIDAWAEADRLLVSWANRASHTFDLVPPEAVKLIEACENALAFFMCSSCSPPKPVWFTNAAGSEWMQCQCGELRWRYGKG